MTTAHPGVETAPVSPSGAADDPGPVVPHPPRWMTLAAAGLLALALGTRGWVAWRGYYYLDDFTFMAKAAHHSPTDLSYLLEPYNSHLMPGAYAWVWLLTHSMPFQYGGVVIVTMGLQGLLGVLFYTLLRRLFGGTSAILVPFALFVLTPLTLPATLWWAAAINQVPQQLAMVAALLAHTAYLRTGRLRLGMVGPLALIGGLLFSEKTLLLVPLVLAFTVLFFATGPPSQRVRAAWVRGRWLWTAYATVTVVYVAFYVVHVPSPARHPGQGSAIVQLALESFVRGVVPGLLGGPWTWAQIGYAGALADPSPFACAVALLVAGTVVAATCLVRRHAWRGWGIALGYALVNLVVLAFSRAAFIGPVIGDEYRYVTDVALVAALGVGLATAPLAGRWRLGPATVLAPRESFRGWLRSPAVSELVDELPKPTTAALSASGALALAVSATWSTFAYDQYWHTNPARAWVQTASAGIASSDTTVVLADASVPDRVAWPLLGRYATVGQLLSPLHHAPRTLADGPSSDHLTVLDSSGRLHRAAIDGIAARKGPVKGCGWRLGTEAVRIPLQRETLPFRWTMRIGYIAAAPASAVVTVGAQRTTVPFHAGLGSVYLFVDGAVDTVEVSPLHGEATICTDEITVGTPVPADGAPR